MKFTLPKSKLSQTACAVAGIAILLCPSPGRAQSTFIVNNSSSAAFMASGSPGNPSGMDLSTINYGNAGTLAIAPASSTKGAFDSILLFNTSAAISQFNTLYGAGGWVITGAKL